MRNIVRFPPGRRRRLRTGCVCRRDVWRVALRAIFRLRRGGFVPVRRASFPNKRTVGRRMVLRRHFIHPEDSASSQRSTSGSPEHALLPTGKSEAARAACVRTQDVKANHPRLAARKNDSPTTAIHNAGKMGRPHVGTAASSAGGAKSPEHLFVA